MQDKGKQLLLKGAASLMLLIPLEVITPAEGREREGKGGYLFIAIEWPDAA